MVFRCLSHMPLSIISMICAIQMAMSRPENNSFSEVSIIVGRKTSQTKGDFYGSELIADVSFGSREAVGSLVCVVVCSTDCLTHAQWASTTLGSWLTDRKYKYPWIYLSGTWLQETLEALLRSVKKRMLKFRTNFNESKSSLHSCKKNLVYNHQSFKQVCILSVRNKYPISHAQ